MRKHIVIIENDKNILEIMQYLLEEVGYIVTGFTAFPSMAELFFLRADCYIIDEWLPGVSGLAICLMLKARIPTKHIPVILTSTTDQSAPMADFCEADAIVRKNNISVDLARVVSAVLSVRAMSLSKHKRS